MLLRNLTTTVCKALLCGLFLLGGSVQAWAGDTVTAKGVIESVMTSKHKVKIKHEAVPEWGWSKMKMKFNVAEDVDISGLQEGQSVEFVMEKVDGKPVIIGIQ